MQARYLDSGLFITLAVAVLVLAATSARAQEDKDSANWVMPGCYAVLQMDDVFRAGVCTGIVRTLWEIGGRGTRIVCSPSGATQAQAIRVVIQYIEARPARMHEPFTQLAIEALAAAWPCR